MSLAGILNVAQAGIDGADYRIALSNANIANAGDTSYSRKTAQLSTISGASAISQATVTRAADAYLAKAVVGSAAAAGRDSAISSALGAYDAALGTVAGGDDLSSLLTTFQSSLTNLTSSANSSAAKASVVQAASDLAGGVSTLSSTIQSLRAQADGQIAGQVDLINTTIDTVASLNNQIVSGASAGDDITNLEDQRDAALQTLSGSLGISYYVSADNQAQVFTATGDLLIGGGAANHLDYDASAALDATSAYPGAISGVTLRGKDITGSLTSGAIGGLISLRDTILPNEQAKLDTLAGALIGAANAASNAGSAYPPPQTLSGVKPASAGDSFSGSGALTVAVTTTTGSVVSAVSLDLSAYATVGDLVGALNGIPGVSASVASGKLVISTTAGQGVALGGAGGPGVSSLFALNDLFTGKGAADIAVNAALATNSAGLPTAALDTTQLAVGQTALSAASSAVADGLGKALGSAMTFGSAGGFPAQRTSLQAYAANFVSSAAALVSNADTQADKSSAVSTAAQTRLENQTNVNTDEELTQLTLFQQQYQANAQLISTVRALFDTLIQMMQA
jgi:flagellar hook-associated protein 1 FlgK